jgi:DNA replication protein DnaC
MIEYESALDRLPPAIRERLEAPCELHPEVAAAACSACVGHSDADDDRQLATEEALAKCVAAIPARYREAATNNHQINAWVRQFNEDPAHTPSLLLLGPTGTGKTYLAYAALKAAAAAVRPNRAGIWLAPRWQALTYADLCASMRPRGRDYEPEQVLKGYLETDLLFIDDLGAGKVSEAVEEVTYRLINGRYNDMRPSIFTTNLDLPSLRDAIGDRVASRLSESCERIVLKGPDRRRNLQHASAA